MSKDRSRLFVHFTKSSLILFLFGCKQVGNMCYVVNKRGVDHKELQIIAIEYVTAPTVFLFLYVDLLLNSFLNRLFYER